MSDGLPAGPSGPQNRLLQRLMASADARGGPLQNRLLARLSQRSAQLTRRSSALPLRSSVLAKYEAKGAAARSLRERERSAAYEPTSAEGGAQVNLFALHDMNSAIARPMMAMAESEECYLAESASSDEEDDDMGFGMFDDCGSGPPPPPGAGRRSRGVAFGALTDTVKGVKYSAAPARALKKRAIPAMFGVGLSEENWAMPDQGYDFKRVDLSRQFDDCDVWPQRQERDGQAAQLTRALKLRFLNAVCVSLVCQADFRDKQDRMRVQLIDQATQLALHEPEFILKVAVYARQELYLRSTANLLLSVAARLEPCRPFLRKYYAAAIRLPTDWIEVAELYQVFDDASLNFGSLPAALRKVMVEKFPDFDEYQLAKYNRSKKKAKPPQRPAGADAEVDAEAEDGETEEQRQRRSFTIKQLLRLLHVRQPAQHVMAIVGKKYPADPEQFRRSGLPGQFDSSRANVRMKLATPETWETQVASRGNKAEVWRDLIDHKKLPYMAMLRNLRNMILAGIGAVHHEKVIRTLTNETAVRNSKQMAFRYLSAYEALSELEALRREAAAGGDDVDDEYSAARAQQYDTPAKKVWWLRRRRAIKARKQQVKYDVHVIGQYRSALDRAVALATVHNVPPIAGRTLLFCDVSGRMDAVCASARGLGKPKTARTMAVLLSLMCQRSCENSQLVCLLDDDCQRPAVRVPVERRTNLLKQTAQVEHLYEKEKKKKKTQQPASAPPPSSDWSALPGAVDSDSCSDDWHDLPSDSDSEDMASTSSEGADDADMRLQAVLDRCLAQKQPVDNIVVMGSGDVGALVRRTLHVYRQTVNPNLLFVNVDLTSARSASAADPAAAGAQEEAESRDVTLHGFSDQILRFVAERGASGQLAAVDAIDVKYKLRRHIRLPPVDLRETILAASAVTSWRTVRVFISSTFLDMHGERDLLIRHVMPELRTRARALRIELQPVDLRWGITARQAEQHKQLELCLAEVDRCQLFVGLLGARCGAALPSYAASEPRVAAFLQQQPAGRSLTALEMLYATRPGRDPAAALFYQRHASFTSGVPAEYMDQFCDLAAGQRRLAELRHELETRGCRLHTYGATYAGVVNGRPAATGLQKFGEDVMESLWTSMQQLFPLQAAAGCDRASEEYTLQHGAAAAQLLVGRRARLARTLEEVQRAQGRVILVAGKPGAGKTCFLSRLYCELDTGDRLSRLLVPAFCGVGRQCASPAGLLAYLRALLARQPLQPTGAAQLTQVAAEVAELLTVRGRRQHVILVLDGLEALWQEAGAACVQWIPDALPQNVTIVVSADDGSALYRRVNALSRVINVSLGSLELSERSALVRHLLQHHSKSLDESVWNNQLRTLTSKRGAGDPLYLKLACEELRTFGLFEQVSGKLAAMGQTVGALTQDIIQRLETDHGTQPVRLALCAVALSPHGMAEDDLYGYLRSGGVQLTVDAVAHTLSQFTFTSLLRSAESLLSRVSTPGEPALLQIAHAEMARVVRLRYLGGAGGEASLRQLAAGLAEYFERSCEARRPAPAAMLAALAHFLGLAGDMERYQRTVCSLRYLSLAAESGLTGDLVTLVAADDVADSAARRQYLQRPHVVQTRQFLQHNSHLISRNPALLIQQALNEPADSWLHEAAEQLVREQQLSEQQQPSQQLGSSAAAVLVRHMNQARTSVSQQPDCLTTLTLEQAVTAAAADSDQGTLYAGLSSGVVAVLQLDSGRQIHSLAGHSESVTGVLLLSGGQHVVSGCGAGRLVAWSVSSGAKLVSQEAHRRRITALAARPDSFEFISVAWSCDLKLWQLRAGSGLGGSCSGSGSGSAELVELRVLTRELQPLSCVAHHPSRSLVATGGWDGKLKIWDTTHMQRKAVRHGHDSSVRCVAISPDANYIISGDMDGQLIVWGTQHGDVILRWRVHRGAVSAVCYLSSQRFVTAGADGDIKVWRSHVGAPLGRLAADSGVLLCAAYREQASAGAAAGEPRFICVSTEGVVSAHRAAGGGRDAALWSRRIQNVTAVACDGRRAYLAQGRVVLVLALSGGTTARQVALDAPVTALACQPAAGADAAHGVIYVGLEDGRVGVSLAERGGVTTSVGHSGQVTCLAVSSCVEQHSDAALLASGGRDGVVHVWRSCGDQWSPVRCIAAYSAPVSAVVWFDRYLVTAGQNAQLHAYQRSCVLSGRQPDDGDGDHTPPPAALLVGNRTPVCSLRVQDCWLLSTGTDGQVLVWSSALQPVTEQWCAAGAGGDLCRLPATAAAGGTPQPGALVGLLPQHDGVQLIDFNKLSLLAGYGDHTAAATGVAPSRLGLVSSSLDGSCKLWRVATDAADTAGGADADAALLALRCLSPAGQAAPLYASVGRAGALTVWRLTECSADAAARQPLQKLYTARLSDAQQESEAAPLLGAAIGPAAHDPKTGATVFVAVARTAAGGCRVAVTLPSDGSVPNHSCRTWRQGSAAPPLCVAVEEGRGAPLLGDVDGFVTVLSADCQHHTTLHCGAAPEPAVTHMCTVGPTLVTCDQNGLVGRVQLSEALNSLRVRWEPVMPPARAARPPAPDRLQLGGSVGRWHGSGSGSEQADPEPMDTDEQPRQTKPAFPTALLAPAADHDQPTMVADAAGAVWWRAGETHCRQQAHDGPVTWLGRDPGCAGVLYTCGADRRLVVWRRSADGRRLQQVGEFTLASAVLCCAARELPAAAATALLCGDDRGRLHLLHVQLGRLADGTGADAGGASPQTAPPELAFRH